MKNIGTKETGTEVLPPEDTFGLDKARQDIAVQSGRTVNLNPGQLLQQAVQNNASVEVLGKLMDLRDRYDAKEAEKAFVEAMVEFKTDPPEIFKNKHVRFEIRGGSDIEYDHATLGHICSVLIKALSEHGISHRWGYKQGGNASDSTKITVSCIITHRQGHSEKVSLEGWPDESGKKNKLQQVSSAVKYLQRYTLLAVTGMEPTDMPDYDGGEPITYISVDQKNKLTDAMRALGCVEHPDRNKAVLQFLKVESLDDLPSDSFDHAMNAIAAKQKKLDEATADANT